MDSLNSGEHFVRYVRLWHRTLGPQKLQVSQLQAGTTVAHCALQVALSD